MLRSSLLCESCLAALLIIRSASSQFIYYNGDSRIVYGAKGLNDACLDSSVDYIRVSGLISLDGNWASTPTLVNRTLRIEGDPNNATNGISFNHRISALVFGQGTNVTFANLSLQDAGPQVISPDSTALNVTQRVYALGVWPSLILLNGSEVHFDNATLQFYSQQSWSRCQYFAQKIVFQLQTMNFGPNITSPNNVTIRLLGEHSSQPNVTNTATNQTDGSVTLSTNNTTMICVDDPNKEDHSVSGVPSSGSVKGGDGFKWWYGLIIGLGSAAVLGLLVGAVFVVLIHRRRQSQQSSEPSFMSSKEQPPSQANGGGSSSEAHERRSVLSEQSTALTHVTANSALAAAMNNGAEQQKQPGFGSYHSNHTSSSIMGSVIPGTMTPTSNNMMTKDSWGELGYLLRERSDFSDLEFGPLIGTGSFGRVYKGRWKGAFVAIKIVDNKGQASKVIALREGMLSHSAQHPNVITTYSVFTQQASAASDAAWMSDSAAGLHGEESVAVEVAQSRDLDSEQAGPSEAVEDTSSTVMVLEYCDRGTLDKAITTGVFMDKSTGGVDLRAIHATLMDIAGGLAYLHSVGVLHGDLKGANVLLKSTTADARRFTAKLADFGMARLLTENSTHVSTKTYGTISYMPIEVLKHGKLTRAVDSYSFAILMWEMFSGAVLYADMTVAQLYYKVCCEHDKPAVPANMPAEYAVMMQQCWSDDPELRPTAAEILQSLMDINASRRASKERSSSLKKPSARSVDLNKSSLQSPYREHSPQARTALSGPNAQSDQPSWSPPRPGLQPRLPPPAADQAASVSAGDPKGNLPSLREIPEASSRQPRVAAPQSIPAQSPFSQASSSIVSRPSPSPFSQAAPAVSRPSPSPFSQPRTAALSDTAPVQEKDGQKLSVIPASQPASPPLEDQPQGQKDARQPLENHKAVPSPFGFASMSQK